MDALFYKLSAWRASKPKWPILPESDLIVGLEALPMLLLKLHLLSLLILFFLIKHKEEQSGKQGKA